MATDPSALSASQLAFLAERHLGTLTTLRLDGTPHVVPVGFTYDPAQRLVRIITGASSVKARNVGRGSSAAVCSVDGGRWLTLEGPATVHGEAAEVAAGEAAYTARYQRPRPNPDRVVLHIAVTRVLGRA